MTDTAVLALPGAIDRVARAFRRSRDHFATHAEVFRQVGDRLDQRLALLAVSPRRVLDLGCRDGYRLEGLAARYPGAAVIGFDPAPSSPRASALGRWLGLRRPARVIAGDPHQLPFEDACFDIVTSNLLLPWCHAPHRVFAEVARVLAPGGAFLFSAVGPDTLIEYRRRWAAVDAHLHAFGLVDMHDLGDALLEAGIAAPVLDRENLVVDYPSFDALERELRGVGAVNLARGRRAGLMSPAVRRLLVRGVVPGRFPVTLELVQGHGWKGELPRRGVGREGTGEYHVSLDSLRGSRR